ncbi:WPP domain-interacting tail-anchored protein 1 [Malania oleifera]|uniref:WPP domain-interacting tail-anchored protein 1 n=1 Tax=Malania oleifera TaxID=397392 RepID=UPI0025AE0474|nr:WPP domain-interacting tail-anchored protein 1 [Malania oleifera]XP_057972883.1 WPP domain-interacting tail-anchored protein 1 [Malania oleifera]
MDGDSVQDKTISFDDVSPENPEMKNAELLEGISSDGEAIQELGSAGEAVLKVELDVACSSEKLVNLNLLMMHVAARESDIEALASEQEHGLFDSTEKAFELDLLSGILDSEVRELEYFMADIQTEIVNARNTISSCQLLGDSFAEMEEKLHDSEESLKQSQEQVSEMRLQSDEFQKTLGYGREENWNNDKDVEVSQNGQSSNVYARIKIQTAEQQRRFLKMLEKSLARELDLEKKLTESRLIEEELKLRLQSSEQEVFCMEEEAVVVWERVFEADNTAEVLMGISKDLIGQLQIFQFNLNGSAQREGEFKMRLQDCTEQLKVKESALQNLESSSQELHDLLSEQTNSLKASLREAEDKLLSDSEALTLKEKVSSPEKQQKESEFQFLGRKASLDGCSEQHNVLYSDLRELKKVVGDLKKKFSEAESRAKSAEARCELLTETNIQLNRELGLLKESGGASEKVDLLERQLRVSDIQLQQAVASAEASEEKQSMLYSTIEDMEILIEDLKSKVSKAETRAESTEEKCIILSESNADLNEELSFLRSRMESLQISLHQAEKTKVATAKCINLRTKVITDLVMQLAVERERLHKQMSSLVKENDALVEKLQEVNRDPSMVKSQGRGGNGGEFLYPEHDFTTNYPKESKEVKEFLATNVETDQVQNASVVETQVRSADSTFKLSTVRTIHAGLLDFKHVSMAVLILLISVAFYLFQQANSPF